MCSSVATHSFHWQLLQLSNVPTGQFLCLEQGRFIKCSESWVIEALETLVSRLSLSEPKHAPHKHKTDDEVAISFIEYLTTNACLIEPVDNQALLQFSTYFHRRRFSLQTKTALQNLLEPLILKTKPFFQLFYATNKSLAPIMHVINYDFSSRLFCRLRLLCHQTHRTLPLEAAIETTFFKTVIRRGFWNNFCSGSDFAGFVKQLCLEGKEQQAKQAVAKIKQQSTTVSDRNFFLNKLLRNASKEALAQYVEKLEVSPTEVRISVTQDLAWITTRISSIRALHLGLGADPCQNEAYLQQIVHLPNLVALSILPTTSLARTCSLAIIKKCRQLLWLDLKIAPFPNEADLLASFAHLTFLSLTVSSLESANAMALMKHVPQGLKEIAITDFSTNIKVMMPHILKCRFLHSVSFHTYDCDRSTFSSQMLIYLKELPHFKKASLQPSKATVEPSIVDADL